MVIICVILNFNNELWLNFIHFSLSLQFYDEHKLLSRYTGEIFRPPILHIQANTIRILFYGNDGTGAGYRATINFSTKNITNEVTSTHCGGLVESFGGAITMMNMTNSSDAAFDCIWLIKPPNSYLHLKTNLLVRIDTFENMGKHWKFKQISYLIRIISEMQHRNYHYIFKIGKKIRAIH